MKLRPGIPMAEDRATEAGSPATEEHDHAVIQDAGITPPVVEDHDPIDVLFGCCEAPRSKHQYPDGVIVEILNLSGEGEACNGSRVFYTGEDKRVLCRFPGYDISKYVVHSDPAKTLQGLMGVIESYEQGALCLTNDGPLILIFKIAGLVRVHMMRSAAHGFEEEFEQSFAQQHGGHPFNDLFSESITTSSWCHLFRQGDRSSAMKGPIDMEGRTMLYLGGVKCSMVEPRPQDLVEPLVPALILSVSTLVPQVAEHFLRHKEYGLVCYRHEGGEAQILADSYLRRVAITTGVSSDYLITLQEDEEQEGPYQFNRVPAALNGKLFVQLASSRFPRILDLLSIYVLCGTRSGKKTATICGFSTQLHHSGRILATPKRGYYNFCRVAGVNPRRELPFPATPSAMRLSIRRIIQEASLVDLSVQFNIFEDAMTNMVPQLISRVMRGGTEIKAAFEVAFGVPISTVVGGLPPRIYGGSAMKQIRSALLLSDQYRLVTLTRFAIKHLADLEVSPLTIAEQELTAILLQYSTSSRRRRMVAQSVMAGQEPDEEELGTWPLPAAE